MEEERMTLEGFQELSIGYRAQYLWSFGRAIWAKSLPKHTCLLYQVENFFVEVTYNKVENKLESVEGFNDTEHLMGYLEDIKFDPIL